MEALINQENGHYVDHIALGVRSTEEGAKWLEDLTGVKPYFHAPESGQWYYSAALNLGGNCALEIIGSNPEHQGFQPIKQILKSFDKPKLFFWYLGTKNFEKAQEVIENQGFKFERIQQVDYTREDYSVAYKRAMIGPGFRSEFPNIIQWESRPKNLTIEKGCVFKSLELVSPISDKLNLLFSTVGVDMRAKKGNPSMKLRFDSPKGEVMLEGGGFNFSGFGAMPKMAKLYLNYLVGK